MHESTVLFSIGPLEVTGPVVTMWAIIAFLAIITRISSMPDIWS